MPHSFPTALSILGLRYEFQGDCKARSPCRYFSWVSRTSSTWSRRILSRNRARSTRLRCWKCARWLSSTRVSPPIGQWKNKYTELSDVTFFYEWIYIAERFLKRLEIVQLGNAACGIGKLRGSDKKIISLFYMLSWIDRRINSSLQFFLLSRADALLAKHLFLLVLSLFLY